MCRHSAVVSTAKEGLEAPGPHGLGPRGRNQNEKKRQRNLGNAEAAVREVGQRAGPCCSASQPLSAPRLLWG